MRQIDNMTPQELDTLRVKGMLAQNYKGLIPAEEKTGELPSHHTFDVENDTNTIESKPAPNKAQHSQWFGVYDTQGKLRATFDSEPEAYFYIRNRGHVNGGSYKPIVNHADKLAEACKIGLACCIAWGGKCEAKGETTLALESVKRAEEIREALAAYEAAQ